MIFGIGVDIVDIKRFVSHLERTPKLVERLFTEQERARPPQSLAARFAAKEAFFKAMGGRVTLRWQEIEVTRPSDGRPAFVLSGLVDEQTRACGVTAHHLSLSHDGGLASAFVIAERDQP